MATITFGNEAVWDNNSSETDKYSTRRPGQYATRVAYGMVACANTIKSLRTALSVGPGTTIRVLTGLLQLDSSYPTNGEDISEIWNYFPKGAPTIIFEQPNAASVKTVEVDTGNKKLKGYTGAFATEVTNGTNLSAVPALRFWAFGV